MSEKRITYNDTIMDTKYKCDLCGTTLLVILGKWSCPVLLCKTKKFSLGMSSSELLELLNNRPAVWLGRKLDFKQPRQSVHQWLKNVNTIPEKYHERIREICAV